MINDRNSHTAGTEQLERSVAQFFFEIGFGNCWAEALVRNGNTPPFPLSDGVIERQWEIAAECHDDPEEFDRHLALADAAPELVEQLQAMIAHYVQLAGCGDCGNWDPEAEAEVIAARAVVAKALGRELPTPEVSKPSPPKARHQQ